MSNSNPGAAPAAHYPLVLQNLARVRCVVVGGGAVAERKVRDLVAGGARPAVISPALTPALEELRQAGQIEHLAREFAPGDLQGAFLAVAATDVRAVNAAVAAEGQRLGMLVNVADDPGGGNFQTMATVRRGDLLFALSTSGGSPSLAAYLRRQIEASYGDEYGRLLDLLAAARPEARQRLTRERQAELWRRVITDETLGWLRQGQAERAERHIRTQLEDLADQS
jgi:siroheme synthase-like protein